MPKRNIVIPEDVWRSVQRECGRVVMETGQPYSVSEWIRRACIAELERTKTRQMTGATP